MKIVSLNSFAMIMSIMVLIRLTNTPTVEGGPTDKAACILDCCGKVCRDASRTCLGWGSRLGSFGIIAAAGCFLIAGGGCAICVSACMALA